MATELTSRAAIASESWRRIRADQRAARTAFAERWTARAAAGLLILTLLYVLIGNKPYVHEVAVDPLTGGIGMSPINRWIWITLGALSIPLLWLRRADLPGAMLRLWPLVLLMGWFALTIAWALDPGAASRRLLLYAINAIICLAVVLGLRSVRGVHAAMAAACAIVVLIDLFSWILMPGRSMTELGLAAIHSHKNTLGAVMLLSGLVCGTWAWGRPTRVGRIFWWGVTLASVALLIGSRSKTSIAIFFALAAFTPLFVLVLQRRAMVIGGLAAVLAAVCLSLLFLYLAASQALALDPFEPLRGVTFTQRTDVWRYVWKQFLMQPLQGWGFGSFWDIDPQVQPSLRTDHWFAQAPNFTNEAHNGYLDLAVTTGLVGLGGALFLLGRWMLRGVILLRRAALAGGRDSRQALAAAVLMGVFPLLFFGHNWMESSYFTANAIFGSVILFVGVVIDLAWTPHPPA